MFFSPEKRHIPAACPARSRSPQAVFAAGAEDTDIDAQDLQRDA
jgi:hypothetical protein